ncbi:MAG: hypothetical protein RM347_015885 [Nostoc sp. ChiQUE02]|uniref:hypothetical protein n=1 Tax=Nostoc sp. ChiQUE02 TaxID=3075377 RepID=UPI002AD3E566|nr:hypothetical protein [Nostoc sp. ChiQUE02]
MNESLNSVNESLILVNESLNSVNESFISSLAEYLSLRAERSNPNILAIASLLYEKLRQRDAPRSLDSQ